MNINDIIQRDMADAEQRERERAERREAAKDELRRQARREVLEAVKDIAGAIAFFALLVAIVWLCCAASGYHWE